jgi:hypothetical protein
VGKCATKNVTGTRCAPRIFRMEGGGVGEGRGADTEAIYNLCLILKIIL